MSKLGISGAELAEAMAVVAALPGEEWTPAGDPRKPFGWNYRISGGIRQVGGDGSLEPAMVQFILLAKRLLPRLLEENERLRRSLESTRQQVAVANGKLSVALRAAGQKESK